MSTPDVGECTCLFCQPNTLIISDRYIVGAGEIIGNMRLYSMDGNIRSILKTVIETN